MQRNVIAAFVDFFRSIQQVNFLSQARDGAVALRQGVSPDLHTQSQGGVCHLYSDMAQTDDSQALAQNFTAGKLLFGLFGVLGDVRVRLVGADPLHAAHYVTSGQQHSRQHQFLYAVGIGAGGIEHHSSLLCQRVQRNVIHTGSRPGHGQ